MLLLLAAVDTAETQTIADGLAKNPLPYFLALVIGVVVVLWGSLATVAWWGVKGQLNLATKRADELKLERDEARKETDQINADHIRDLVRLTLGAEEFLRLKKELEGKAKEAEEAKRAADARARALKRGEEPP